MVTIVSTKSNAAMREFHALLADYGRERARLRPRRIVVANGEDIPVPTTSWDDLVLPSGMADEIRTNVDGFFLSRDRYREMGLPHRRGFLFAGAPGCGKTMTIKAIARNTRVSLIAIQAKASVREADVERAFYLADQTGPAIIIMEDLDRLVNAEGMAISHFLNILDGLKAVEGVLVLATCNHPERLDPALLHRPSRFDRVWRFPLPDLSQRAALLGKKGGSCFSARALNEAAEKSEGFSMAYVQEIVVNALLQCAHAATPPTDEHLGESVKVLRSQRRNASKREEDLNTRDNLGFRHSDDDEEISRVPKILDYQNNGA